MLLLAAVSGTIASTVLLPFFNGKKNYSYIASYPRSFLQRRAKYHYGGKLFANFCCVIIHVFCNGYGHLTSGNIMSTYFKMMQ